MTVSYNGTVTNPTASVTDNLTAPLTGVVTVGPALPMPNNTYKYVCTAVGAGDCQVRLYAAGTAQIVKAVFITVTAPVPTATDATVTVSEPY